MPKFMTHFPCLAYSRLFVHSVTDTNELTVESIVSRIVLGIPSSCKYDVCFHKNQLPDTLPSGVPLYEFSCQLLSITNVYPNMLFYVSNNTLLTLHSVCDIGMLELNPTALPHALEG